MNGQDPTDGAAGIPEATEGEARPVWAVSMLLVGLAAAALISFVARLLLARGLGTDGLGSFMSGLALVTITLPAGAWGIGQLWLERHGDDPTATAQWMRGGWRTSLMTTLLAALTTLVVARLVFGDGDAFWVSVGLVPLIAVGTVIHLAEAFAQLAGRWRTVAILPLVIPGSILVSGVAAIAGALPVPAAMVGVAVAVGAALPSAIAVVARVGRLPAGTVAARRILFRAAPYALSAIVFTVYFYTDIVMLGAMRTPSDVGIYSAAVTLVAGTFLVPRALFQMYFAPAKHRWVVHDQARLASTYQRASVLMLALGIPVAVMGYLVAGPVMELVFGEDFGPGAEVLRILVAVIPVRFASSACELILGTRDHARWRVYWQAMAAVCNVAINLPMISTWGYRGAAVSTVITEVVVLAGFRWKAWRVHRRWR